MQAKHDASEHTVTKRDIDTFLSESNRPAIGSRPLIASTDKLADSAREVMAGKAGDTCLLARMCASA